MIDILHHVLSYEDIYEKWLREGKDNHTALRLTREQVEAFEAIVKDDAAWGKLLGIAAKGRIHDAWLAADWPSGFDELILCTPLCKLVEWECAQCTIGSRQKNSSCANDDSVFGLIGVLVSNADRKGLLGHLEKVKKMLNDDSVQWDTENKQLKYLT
jgi:hypothetical protein